MRIDSYTIKDNVLTALKIVIPSGTEDGKMVNVECVGCYGLEYDMEE